MISFSVQLLLLKGEVYLPVARNSSERYGYQDRWCRAKYIAFLSIAFWNTKVVLLFHDLYHDPIFTFLSVYLALLQ